MAKNPWVRPEKEIRSRRVYDMEQDTGIKGAEGPDRTIFLAAVLYWEEASWYPHSNAEAYIILQL